ncbi:MAG: cation diffusion facilitator family transporter [Pseudomonadales bacterium]|nr:cation diffusion facilitator family transporter [Pseudomonadales bacterium]
MTKASAQTQATRVTLVGMILDLALGITKIVGGALTQSFALVTDGIHSLTDAITDIFVLMVARIAHSAPDADHPYGHGRFETLGTIAMGVIFFTTAGILLYDSYIRLQDTASLPIPAPAGLAIALVSIASKEWIYHYTMRVANSLNSSLLKANAWHSRSDAISSVAVLVGLLAAQQGYAWMDTVAGVFVSLIIAKIGWELCTDSLKELVDTAIPQQRRKQIEQTILSVDGILGITSIRSRSSGGKIILELRLLVNPRISVSEGHQLGEIVSRSITGNFSDIADVTVHIDPEEHSEESHLQHATSHLPPRPEVIATIKEACSDLVTEKDIDSIVLHYLERGIEVEITLSASGASSVDAAALQATLETVEHLVNIKIFSKLAESNLTSQLS